MRTLGALPLFRTSKSPLFAFAFLIVVIFAAYKSAEAILADDIMSLAFAAVLFIGGAVFIAILNDWRRGLYFLIAWILFEDMVRKYLGNNMAIYFAKDFLALALYLSFFRARLAKRIEKFQIPFRLPLALFFWFCLIQIFNPASSSIYYGILGMKVNFIYVPLIYVGYAFAESEVDLRRFMSFLCVLIIVVAGLGLAQSIIGPTFLNPRVIQEDIRELSTTYRTAPISGLLAYRPTSVFVSAGRFQDFLIVAWIVCLGFSGYLLLRTRRGRTIAFTAVGMVAAAGSYERFPWGFYVECRNNAGFFGRLPVGSPVAPARSDTCSSSNSANRSSHWHGHHSFVDDFSGRPRLTNRYLFRDSYARQPHERTRPTHQDLPAETIGVRVRSSALALRVWSRDHHFGRRNMSCASWARSPCLLGSRAASAT